MSLIDEAFVFSCWITNNVIAEYNDFIAGTITITLSGSRCRSDRCCCCFWNGQICGWDEWLFGCCRCCSNRCCCSWCWPLCCCCRFGGGGLSGGCEYGCFWRSYRSYSSRLLLQIKILLGESSTFLYFPMLKTYITWCCCVNITVWPFSCEMLMNTSL